MRPAILQNKSFVKNTGDFSFFINSNGVINIEGIPTFSSVSSKLQFFVNGVIYNKSDDQIIQEFAEKGIRMVEELEGNFILFVICDSQLYLVTDKVNSKKAFYAHLDDGWYISNNIDYLPKNRCTISQEGFACFLANGVMLNTLTLYKEIVSARGGSIYSFIDQRLFISTYWEFVFNYSSDKRTSVSIEELQKELEVLIIDSIKEMAPAVSHAAVSLSAGYDIRGILGVIDKYTSIPEVSCFSYAASNNKKENSDSYLAKKIAEVGGHSHTIYSFYKGDLLKHIVNNAQQGKCLTNFCDELETWNALAESKKYTDLIVGEECFGYFNVPLENEDKLFSLLAINSAGSLKWLEQFVNTDLYKQLNSSLTNVRKDISVRLEQYSDVHDKKDYLYFDQRLKDVLLPWRENIGSKVGCVHNPLLNSKILEYVMKLSPIHRQNKNLYKRTISNMFPELFDIGFATASGYSINWELEIRKNQTKLIEFVEQSDSLLDELIPKQAIIDMIHKQSSIREITAKNITRIIRFGRKKNKIFNTIVTPIFGPLNGPLSSRYVYPDFLVIRLLIIREQLKFNKV